MFAYLGAVGALLVGTLVHEVSHFHGTDSWPQHLLLAPSEEAYLDRDPRVIDVSLTMHGFHAAGDTHTNMAFFLDRLVPHAATLGLVRTEEALARVHLTQGEATPWPPILAASLVVLVAGPLVAWRPGAMGLGFLNGSGLMGYHTLHHLNDALPLAAAASCAVALQVAALSFSAWGLLRWLRPVPRVRGRPIRRPVFHVTTRPPVWVRVAQPELP